MPVGSCSNKKIFHKVFVEHLNNKARVFVTSNLTWLSDIPRILILGDKEISGDENYNELHKSNSVFIKLEVDSCSRKESFKAELSSINVHCKKIT
jgi:ABC-type transport system involved in cytochrome bd biosynthesis fused ATPase/permease subunit